MLDAHRAFETPEGIRLRLEVAGPLPRALALLVDLAIRAVFYLLAAFLLDQLGKFGHGLLLLLIFFSEWLYPTIFEATRGATPGKQAMNLRVTMDDGTSLTWGASFARNLLRAVDFLPFMYLLGLLISLTNNDFKRIGDVIARSIVVYAPQADASPTCHSRADTTTARPLPLALTAEEQRLIMEFSDQCDFLSAARQREIANLLQPLLQQQDDAAITTLKQYAAWIKGAQA